MFLPLVGALLTATIPRALPWAKSFCPFRAYWVFSTVQVEKNSRIMQKSLWGENKMCKFASLNGWLHKFYNF